MVLLTQPTYRIPVVIVPFLHNKHVKLQTPHNQFAISRFPQRHNKQLYVRYANTPTWEPAPVTYASDDEGQVQKQATNIFETMTSANEAAEASTADPEQLAETTNQSFMQSQYLKWPLWLLGPALLLATGVVPTLWLPISSIFIGPNIATLLALTGLDCIFNLGASLFLLMADSSARPNNNTEDCTSKPPTSYKFWNMVANILGFIIPLVSLFGSQNGYLQPQLPFISFAVLLGPYFLLLTVQLLTEMLTWHWQSPVWLVTPVVYEAYRLLQLMRGLRLVVELNAPSWMVHTIRGLVCGWVLVLGMQLMRVAWYAGFTARAHSQYSAISANDD